MFWKFWRRRPRSLPVSRPAFFAAPDAEQDIAVIADVHGMDLALGAMLDLLAREAPNARIIFVGDLIDRGEDSAQVLQRVFKLGETVEVLLGNHEDMLLKFLDDPARAGRQWLRCGGLQTLASFGVGGVRDMSPGAEMSAARDSLRAAMGPELEAWLVARPRIWSGGNVAVTHAGADPWRAIDAQPPQAFTWGHPAFRKRARSDGLWVVHGHDIVPEPVAADGIISIDTGAYASGGLTAAVLSNGAVRFLSVRS